MWLNFFKSTFRSLNKNKSYILINILGLSIAFAVFIALALYIQFELSFDNFNENNDRLYRVEQIMIESGRSERISGCPTPVWKAFKNEFPEVEYSIRFFPQEHSVETSNGNLFKINMISTDNEFLSMFSYEIIKGDKNNALIEPFSIIKK